jgi:hypothetical protein
MSHSSTGNADPSKCCVSGVNNRENRKKTLLAIAKRSPLCDSSSQLFEHLLGVLPVNTCVRDGDTILQTLLAFLGNLLVACKLR